VSSADAYIIIIIIIVIVCCLIEAIVYCNAVQSCPFFIAMYTIILLHSMFV